MRGPCKTCVILDLAGHVVTIVLPFLTPNINEVNSLVGKASVYVLSI